MQWLGFAAFHLGDYKKALEVLAPFGCSLRPDPNAPCHPCCLVLQVYQELLAKPDPDPVFHLYAACCLYYLGLHADAEVEANKGPATRLQNRILFHLAHKKGDETKLMGHHRALSESTEDQLCLAAIHYLRAHFQVRRAPNASDGKWVGGRPI